jgi:hypothetical protein
MTWRGSKWGARASDLQGRLQPGRKTVLVTDAHGSHVHPSGTGPRCDVCFGVVTSAPAEVRWDEGEEKEARGNE